MPGAGGGSLAAPIWGQIVARYYIGRTPGEWTAPPGLTFAYYDRQTGALACPHPVGARGGAGAGGHMNGKSCPKQIASSPAERS